MGLWGESPFRVAGRRSSAWRRRWSKGLIPFVSMRTRWAILVLVEGVVELEISVGLGERRGRDSGGYEVRMQALIWLGQRARH